MDISRFVHCVQLAQSSTSWWKTQRWFTVRTPSVLLGTGNHCEKHTQDVKFLVRFTCNSATFPRCTCVSICTAHVSRKCHTRTPSFFNLAVIQLSPIVTGAASVIAMVLTSVSRDTILRDHGGTSLLSVQELSNDARHQPLCCGG